MIRFSFYKAALIGLCFILASAIVSKLQGTPPIKEKRYDFSLPQVNLEKATPVSAVSSICAYSETCSEEMKWSRTPTVAQSTPAQPIKADNAIR
ncbi:hypothetical protein EUZ85_10410 [Hahella sp. KA22]|uniref:hypothetical protein n=1 Tax=Hahella sp. KA22 TaxID=1628392 RepID=UPI000FDED017|nr:hypothetical protein [Hahella sp. KA22]AZZ91116.1 hypothetical protein ENC22_07855 [Hahella sp. KA22]QAY54484.1 hypothetical protein EUZ85_10410 [Hahella sp. KA22]